MEQQTQNANPPHIAEEADASAGGQASYAAEVEAAKQQRLGTEHPEFVSAVQKVQAGLDAKVEEIKSDRRLDKSEQFQQINDVWNRAANYHGQLMQAYEDDLEEKSAQQERRVFHIGTQQMQDSVRSAYNDLYDRTDLLLSSGDHEGITAAEEEMERLWERAERTGDRALQIAVGHRATELGMAKLRDAWLATSEEKTKAWGRYVEARQKLEHFRSPQERLWGILAGGFSLSKPPEA